jgi:undecaprenyl-diphosphatase
MNLLQILILAIVQGAAELLPVSSSAHVIVAEKLMGLDPTAPAMTLLLVMLHTGTMFAVIVYFWRAWRETYFSSMPALRRRGLGVIVGTAATGVVGLALQAIIKRLFANQPGFEIEHLFGNATLMAVSLAAAGVLILFASRQDGRDGAEVTTRSAAWIGAVQGLCLPFRGFSRSGATISTGIALGVARQRAEEFSFALAVVLTPAVIAREAWRLAKAPDAASTAATATAGALGHPGLTAMLVPGLLGMVLSFAAGLAALRWLSSWLEHGRWHFFGIYCLAASLVVLAVG